MHVGSKTSPEEVVPARICRAATKHTCWIKNKLGGSVTGEDITYMLDQKQARGKPQFAAKSTQASLLNVTLHGFYVWTWRFLHWISLGN